MTVASKSSGLTASSQSRVALTVSSDSPGCPTDISALTFKLCRFAISIARVLSALAGCFWMLLDDVLGGPHPNPPQEGAHPPAAEPAAEGAAELRDHRERAHAVNGVVVAIHIHQVPRRERQLGQLLVVEEVVGLWIVRIYQLRRGAAQSFQDRQF